MKFLLFISIILPVFSWAESCPSGNAPQCPSTGVRILDDTYPVQSFVISQQSFTTTSRVPELPRKTMLEVMRAYNFNSATIPNIIFPARQVDYDYLKPLLIDDLVRAGRSREEASRLVEDKVRHVEATPWTWQQDYFEATFDQSTGKPQINYSEIYEQRDRSSDKANTRAAFTAMGGANICGLTAGNDLKSSYLQMLNAGTIESAARKSGTTPTHSAEFGGNMEGLPGGLCLVGTNMTDEFAEQVCGSKENIVKIEVSWLSVGHVDEIMKVVPDRRVVTGRPPECAFSIMSADTELGLSLLSVPTSLNKKVLQLNLDPVLTNATSASGLGENDAYHGSLLSSPSTILLCRIINGRSDRQKQNGGEGGSVIEASLEFFMSRAYAQERTAEVPASLAASADDQKAFNCINQYDEVTNQEFVEKIQTNSGLLTYNTAIGETLKRSRQKIYDSILGRLPQCRPYFQTVDSMFTKVPNFFGPQDPDEAGTHVRNGRVGLGAEASSFFPNPTNAIMMNNSVLFPGPVPSAYKEHLERVTRGLGLTPIHLDTWDYAHTGQGNIHCSSHSIPYCRPAGAR